MNEKPLLMVDVDGVLSLFGFHRAKLRRSGETLAFGEHPPLGQHDPPEGSWHSIDGIPHYLSVVAARHLLALVSEFDLVWCSGWEEKADEHLPHLLGVPRGLPHLCFARSDEPSARDGESGAAGAGTARSGAAWAGAAAEAEVEAEAAGTGAAWAGAAAEAEAAGTEAAGVWAADAGTAGTRAASEKSIHGHWKLAAIDAYAGTRPLAWIDDCIDPACHAWARERAAPTLLVQTAPARGLTELEAAQLRAWARAQAAV